MLNTSPILTCLWPTGLLTALQYVCTVRDPDWYVQPSLSFTDEETEAQRDQVTYLPRVTK